MILSRKLKQILNKSVLQDNASSISQIGEVQKRQKKMNSGVERPAFSIVGCRRSHARIFSARTS
jgi:hypothetical protein